MHTNNAAKFDSTLRRNLHHKNVALSPLRLSSPLGLTMGVLMLMALGTPSAHATPSLLTYYNFNGEVTGTAPPLPSSTDVTGTQATTLVNDATNAFPSGQIFIQNVYPPPPPASNTTPAGTTLNQWPGGPGQPADGTGAGGALDLAGNANINVGTQYCFDIGGINVGSSTIIQLSFAIASVGNGGQFSTLSLHWGSSNSATTPPTTFAGTFTSIAPILGTNTHTVTYQQVTATLIGSVPAGQFLWIQFCFGGAKNDANGNDTLIDNIQVTGDVPEPATAISGALAAIGLCWSQRKRVSGFLRARLA
jgi:hypothetical protein